MSLRCRWTWARRQTYAAHSARRCPDRQPDTCARVLHLILTSFSSMCPVDFDLRSRLGGSHSEASLRFGFPAVSPPYSPCKFGSSACLKRAQPMLLEVFLDFRRRRCAGSAGMRIAGTPKVGTVADPSALRAHNNPQLRLGCLRGSGARRLRTHSSAISTVAARNSEGKKAAARLRLRPQESPLGIENRNARLVSSGMLSCRVGSAKCATV